ncbi:MAG: SusF/SusE family outer membrane protein [Bacteroidaceae bacterium]|nr:SusF/SusE family outer membrane protein [Bacteroidaceae bacterium]
MKKIFLSLLTLSMALFLVTSCDEDRDSNPIFQEAPSFVLNTPAYAANNVYDLKNSEYVVLTTSQPDYGGFPVSTVYTANVSLDGENFTPLSTTSTSAKFLLPASELNEYILEQLGEEPDLSNPVKVYVYLTAHLFVDETLGVSKSNTIELPLVKAYDPNEGVDGPVLPTSMYIVGDFAASNGWSTFVPFQVPYSQDNFYYAVVYMQDGAEFKINPDNEWKGNDKGYGQVTFDDQSSGGFKNGGDSETSNMKVTNGGWYTFIVRVKASGQDINYTVIAKDAAVYVIGAAADPDNWSMMDEWRFTAPADANGEWVSPPFAGAGELRMFVDCGIDWWKTEFTIKSDGTLYYRDADIPKNWAENVGPDYSQQVSAGQKAYVNFTAGTGSVK